MDLGQLKERVDYIEGELAELHDGEAEDKGARIENDRNHSDIMENRSRIRKLEEKAENIEEYLDHIQDDLQTQIDFLQEDLEEVKEE